MHRRLPVVEVWSGAHRAAARSQADCAPGDAAGAHCHAATWRACRQQWGELEFDVLVAGAFFSDQGEKIDILFFGFAANRKRLQAAGQQDLFKQVIEFAQIFCQFVR